MDKTLTGKGDLTDDVGYLCLISKMFTCDLCQSNEPDEPKEEDIL